jgi:hypothetical protein
MVALLNSFQVLADIVVQENKSDLSNSKPHNTDKEHKILMKTDVSYFAKI